MAEQYGRRAVLNLNGREYDTGQLGRGLRMAFSIKKSIKREPNQAEIKVWNLSEESRAKIVIDPKDGFPVILQAGYNEDINLLFDGDMRRVDQIRDGANWISYLRVGDGELEIKQSRVRSSFKPGTKPKQIFEYLTKQLGLPAKDALDRAKKGDFEGAIKSLSSGYVVSGQTYDEICKMCSPLGFDVSIQNGALTILKDDETIGSKAIVLNSDTGLVGSPGQAFQDKQHIVTAQALLNGDLVPGAAVQLESLNFNGFYRVERVTMTGDTHGQDWFCNLELKALK
jgi:hypothetical protein